MWMLSSQVGISLKTSKQVEYLTLLNAMRLMAFSLSTSKLNTQTKSIPSLMVLSSMPKEAVSCTCFVVGSVMRILLKVCMLTLKSTNTATPLVVTFGMLSDKHQDVMSQPSWTLGWNNLVIQFSLSKLKMMS